MEKIKSFLYPKAEFIWWGLIAVSAIQASPKILILNSIFVGVVPYLIGKFLHKDRWFYSYYIQLALSLASYQILMAYLYSQQPIVPILIKVVIPNLLGTFAGLFYFQTHKNSKYNKLITFMIFAATIIMAMIFFENI